MPEPDERSEAVQAIRRLRATACESGRNADAGLTPEGLRHESSRIARAVTEAQAVELPEGQEHARTRHNMSAWITFAQRMSDDLESVAQELERILSVASSAA